MRKVSDLAVSAVQVGAPGMAFADVRQTVATASECRDKLKVAMVLAVRVHSGNTEGSMLYAKARRPTSMHALFTIYIRDI